MTLIERMTDEELFETIRAANGRIRTLRSLPIAAWRGTYAERHAIHAQRRDAAIAELVRRAGERNTPELVANLLNYGEWQERGFAPRNAHEASYQNRLISEKEKTMYGEDDGGFFRRETEGDEPSHNDEVLCCPDCETPNQFGELCPACDRERQRIAEEGIDEEPYQQGMEIDA